MGLFRFAKSAGRKLGRFGGEDAARAEELAVEAKEAAERSREVADQSRAVAADITAAIASHGLDIRDLTVGFASDIATLRGQTSAQADAEKAVLIAGNTEGVAAVDDRIQVQIPEPPALHHTVVKGDTLSGIAKAFYGTFFMFEEVFEANKPMLTHPNLIYPGQVLRIPRADHKLHTVARGETLGSISNHYYGTSQRYEEIFEANSDRLSNPDVITTGMELKVPLSGPAAEVGCGYSR